MHFSIHGLSSCFERGLQCFKAAELTLVQMLYPKAGTGQVMLVFLVSGGIPSSVGRSIVLKHWGTALAVLV